ncbi:intermembrane transport protein PqiB [Endozoicomonas sp. SCSIO W0465]|uniref:intermembrane transport protein PqiB n=1 Tax=Endozoicomonas sp. SCSIO W0465 TaxID=2918516 RepID=UPI002074CA79|nr:intermembrane transport protein PqiB [Endozoicomonas sp. SCSIO W0465]USE36973.1 intermembrane transport protein PqiB [Endozoicomonas sp. SCSIO W0465]
MDKVKPTATVSQDRRFSPVWIIPIVSLIVAAWMIYQYMSQQGAEIHLTVQTAEGVVPDKTLVKVRSVKVGMVTAIKLSQDYNQIDLTVRMDSGTDRMLRKDSEFWLVKPRIGTEGVTGLETLLSGPYIELEPGDSKEKRADFVMLSAPPIAGPDVKGTRVMLVAREAGKLTIGDPVMYEGYVVGRVEKTGFDVEKHQANYQLFIFQPYSGLLRTRSRFWLNSGIDFNLNARGFSIDFASLETLIAGGVTFAVPEGSPEGELLKEEMSEFELYDNLQEVRANMYEQLISYAMLFTDSVRGLSPGAPVEYRGIRIGTVKQVPLVLNGKASVAEMKIPVLVNFELERIDQLASSRENIEQLEQSFANAFNNGLRASLKTANYLTGSLYIDINFYPDKVHTSGSDATRTYYGYNVFPTIEGEFVLLQHQVEHILSKLEKLPIDKTADYLNQSLVSLDVAGQQLKKTLKDVDSLLVQKETQQLPQAIHGTLADLQSILQGFRPGSTNYAEIAQVLLRINQALGQLSPLLQTLNEQPDALIFGAKEAADPIPVKGSNP